MQSNIKPNSLQIRPKLKQFKTVFGSSAQLFATALRKKLFKKSSVLT